MHHPVILSQRDGHLYSAIKQAGRASCHPVEAKPTVFQPPVLSSHQSSPSSAAVDSQDAGWFDRERKDTVQRYEIATWSISSAHYCLL